MQPSPPDADGVSAHAQPEPGFPTVGILGGGQLGRMMAAAALQLGLQTRFFQTDDSGPTAGVARVFTGDWTDTQTLRAFIDGCDVVTLENEWVDAAAVQALLPESIKLWPSLQTMQLVSDKVRQKEHANLYGLPAGPWCACSNADDLKRVAEDFGFPLMVKRPRQSYDGYGNRTARNAEELQQAYEALAQDGRVLVEQWVDFVRELAVMVARRPGGEDVVYPVTGTLQKDHRCEAVEVPAPIAPSVAEAASLLARRAAAAYGCVGVVGVELFELADGTLLLNEIAPRPHNTGHYTMDACVTSQFENHLRAVLDLPLGETTLLPKAVVMVNVLGRRHGTSSAATLRSALAVPGATVHIYSKREVRPGRKMGHVTAVGDTLDQARARAYEAANRLEL